MGLDTLTLKETLTLVVSAAAVTVAAITLIKGIIEFRRSTVTKRLELFLSMRSRLREDAVFINICSLLEHDDPALRDVPLIQKDRLVGFFEELAIMLNSGLINQDVSVYMFSYYAVACKNSAQFWHGLNKDQVMWSLFFDFARRMEAATRRYAFNRERLRIT